MIFDIVMCDVCVLCYVCMVLCVCFVVFLMLYFVGLLLLMLDGVCECGASSSTASGDVVVERSYRVNFCKFFVCSLL